MQEARARLVQCLPSGFFFGQHPGSSPTAERRGPVADLMGAWRRLRPRPFPTPPSDPTPRHAPKILPKIDTRSGRNGELAGDTPITTAKFSPTKAIGTYPGTEGGCLVDAKACAKTPEKAGVRSRPM